MTQQNFVQPSMVNMIKQNFIHPGTTTCTNQGHGLQFSSYRLCIQLVHYYKYNEVSSNNKHPLKFILAWCPGFSEDKDWSRILSNPQWSTWKSRVLSVQEQLQIMGMVSIDRSIKLRPIVYWPITTQRRSDTKVRHACAYAWPARQSCAERHRRALHVFLLTRA